MGLFGFFVGRCARKLPIIDNNLPWTMHRGQMPLTLQDGQHPPSQPTIPRAPNPKLHHYRIRLINDSRHTDQYYV
jgi:hypothetical protein